MNKIVAPSLLAADFLNLEKDIMRLNETKAQWLHLDVMDGVFVPNLTFGYDLITRLRTKSTMFFDVHLMISNPLEYVDKYCQAGADMFTFHYESIEPCEIQMIIERIKMQNVKVGISIKPNTPVDALLNFVDEIDMILIMSVEPGFGGQSFIVDSYEKIKYFDLLRKECGYKYLIQVDGGVNETNQQQLKDAGCDVLVAGSFVFSDKMDENIEMLGM